MHYDTKYLYTTLSKNIINILFVKSVDNSKIFTNIDIDSFNLIVKNSTVVPVSIQGYWAINGKYVNIYSNEECTVSITYLQNPDPSSWTEEDDFVTTLGYGYGFISDCIELASSLLKRQIGIEG